MTQDDIYASFILALDRAENVTVSDREADFIESNLDRFSFSRKQGAWIEQMIEKYADKIGWTDPRK
jgi:hypothetical protein